MKSYDCYSKKKCPSVWRKIKNRSFWITKIFPRIFLVHFVKRLGFVTCYWNVNDTMNYNFMIRPSENHKKRQNIYCASFRSEQKVFLLIFNDIVGVFLYLLYKLILNTLSHYPKFERRWEKSRSKRLLEKWENDNFCFYHNVLSFRHTKCHHLSPFQNQQNF